VSANSVESKIIERFRLLLSERVSVWKIILFGSRASGDADPDSDMDILVVLNGKADKPSFDLEFALKKQTDLLTVRLA